MTRKRLTLIHTSAVMVPLFGDLCGELLPDVEAVHMVDETVLKDILRDGRLVKATARRVVQHILAADQAGTDRILVTCSSIGPATELGRELVETPVLRVDEPMAAEALRRGRRIGVVATLPSTLEPTVALIRRRGQDQRDPVDVTARLCEGAFEAVIAGDGATHDRLVARAVTDLARDVDVLVLAQASMARAVASLSSHELGVPVLTSPRLAVASLAEGLR